MAGVNRTNLYNAQTPQGFFKRDIFAFYNKKDESKTDDVGLAIKNGLTVKFVKGEENNKKITTMADMISNNTGQNIHTEFRTGIGYDVHAFEKGQTIILCGIKIPYKYSLMGHSDADVLIHVICDSLLGAANLGDIGKHFPDSSDEYKDIDSKILLERVMELIRKGGYEIGNIDSTICLETPKLESYIDLMRGELSRCMNIKADVISIKATTTEKLGFVGREEGISAYAIVLINKVGVS